MARDIGLKNTLTFKWKEDAVVLGRQAFTQDILMDSLGLEVKDIFCLQDNPRERGYDLTLHTRKMCADLQTDWWNRKEKEDQFKDFEVHTNSK